MSQQFLLSNNSSFVKIDSTGQLSLYDVCGKLRIRLNCNGSIQLFNSDGLTQNIIAPDNQLLSKNNTLDDGSGNLTLAANLIKLPNSAPNISSPNPFGLGQAYYDGTGWNPLATSAMIARFGNDIPFIVYYNTGLTVGTHYTPTQLFRIDTNGIVTSSGNNSSSAPASSSPWYGTPTSSRAFGTVYQNLTGKNLLVIIGIEITSANGSAQLTYGSSSSPSTFGGIVQAPSTQTYGSMSAIIPNGYYYEVQESGVNLYAWIEQTI
jgi:hypothetical protein